MVRSWRMIVLGLMLILHGQDAIKDEAKECILCCGRKVTNDILRPNFCLSLKPVIAKQDIYNSLISPLAFVLLRSEDRTMTL